LKRLCVICARGGSKGIKGKNLRPLAGRPLIAHTISQAQDSEMFDSVAVSSDDDAILEVAREWKADHLVRRPAELASDTAPKIPAICHCVESVEERTGVIFEVIVDLDATAPLRSKDDIRGAIALLEESGGANVVSGMPARRSPYFNQVELGERGRVRLSKPPQKPIARRQDAPKCYDLNASVFVWRREALFSDSDAVIGDDTLLYVMPEERSIDIDTEMDFQFVQFLMARRASAA